MKSNWGLFGAFVFAFGGAILSDVLYELFNPNGTTTVSEGPIDIIGFIGFLFVGIGLWLIVQSGKPEREHN